MACQLMIALINLYPVVTDIKQKGQTDTEPEKTADILQHHHSFPYKITSEKWVQKFHTDDTSLPRCG